MNSIEVKNLTYRYNENSEDVLKDISFTVKSGEWIAIVGHNGSGKSTLARNLNGLLAPTKGSIYIDDTELSEATVWDIRRKIGIVFQNPDNQFVGATVADDVAFGLENRQVPYDEMHERVEAALASVHMTDYAKKEPARLSGGQKQRIALAGVIAVRPEIIILDEATSMLDPKGRQDILHIVQGLQQRTNNTVLSITHDLEEATLADRILVMDSGHLIATGTPREIFSQHELLRSAGLTLPFAMDLALKLKQAGLSTEGTFLSSKELIEQLWTLHSKM